MTEIPPSTVETGAAALWRSGLGKLTREEAEHEARRVAQAMLDEGGLVLASEKRVVRTIEKSDYPLGGKGVIVTEQPDRPIMDELAREREDHDRLYENGLERDRRLRLALFVVEAAREVRDDARRVGRSQVKVNPDVFDRFCSALAAYDKREP